MGTAHGRPEPELGSSKKRMQPELPPMTLSYSVALLCLASPDTVATVRRVASAAGREVRSVSTVAEALASLPGAGALVAALRNEPSTFLFDEGCGDVSTLITQAKQAGCVVVVYSHTAVASPDVGRACLDAGADAVVCSAEGLQQQVALFAMDSAVEQADLTPRPMGDAAAAAGRGAADASAAAAQQPALPDGASDNSAEADYYPSLLRRAQRDGELAGLMGEQHEAVHFHRRQTTQLRSMIASLPRPLLTTGAAAAAAGESSYARVVAISDTHAYHANMDLPPGDVLIHGGDLVGNYGRESDIAADFASFVRWLHAVAPSYTDVVFIAGNHDTLLDPACGRNDPAFAKRLAEARKLLETGLPSNVRFKCVF